MSSGRCDSPRALSSWALSSATLCVLSWFQRGNEPKQKRRLWTCPGTMQRDSEGLHPPTSSTPCCPEALLSLGSFLGTLLLLWKQGELSHDLPGITQHGHRWPCSTGEYLGTSWGMAFGTEGWDRVLGQEGQRWHPHPAASHGVFLPGVEGFELRQLGPAAAALFVLGARSRGRSLGGMLDRAALAAPALSVLEAHHSVGLKSTGHFRVSLWDVCLLTPRISHVNFAFLVLRQRGTSWRWA